MAKRKWYEIPWVQVLTFTALMIVLQSAGAIFFPEKWIGADTPGEIIGVSLLCGTLYAAFMWLFDFTRARKDQQ